MASFFTMNFLTELLLSTVRMATPILLVALAETYSERAGMVNIGLDGIMAIGALVGFLVGYETGVPGRDFSRRSFRYCYQYDLRFLHHYPLRGTDRLWYGDQYFCSGAGIFYLPAFLF